MKKKTVATVMVTIGALMLMTSLVLSFGLGIPGAALHDTLQIGGLALAVIGWILRR